MRIHETSFAVAAKNREQGARAQLGGGCIFAVGMVIVALTGTLDLAFIPVIGIVIGCAGRMVVESNRVGR